LLIAKHSPPYRSPSLLVGVTMIRVTQSHVSLLTRTSALTKIFEVMGSVLTRLRNPFTTTKKRVQVLMSGLDGSGKTSIVHRIKWGTFVNPGSANVSYYMEEITHNNITFLLYDLGASDKIRQRWISIFKDAEALIYVIDCTDDGRIEDAKYELHQHLRDPNMKGVQLLVLVSKRDLPNEMTNEMVIEQLDLTSIEDRDWHIESTSCKTGEGLFEGLAWIERGLREE
ncbi:hypothetical protein PENTCL1PPCAC_4254, partial [Pristionchus entomophagus]